jgi:AcrR family transcriptional regulator
MFALRPETATAEIGRVALALLEAHGAEALTMRRLAEAAGIPVASLYRHVAGKADVLDRVLDLVFAGIPDAPDAPGYWTRALEERVRALHGALDTHPGVVRLFGGRPLVMPAALRFLDQLAGILRRGGLRDADAAAGARGVVALVAGLAMLEAGERAGDAAAGPGAVAQHMRSLPARDYPHLAAAWERGGVEGDAGFDAAVRIWLAGVAGDVSRPPD